MSNVFQGKVASVGVFPIKEEIKNKKVEKPGEHYGKQFNIDKTHTIAIKVIGLQVNGQDYDRWIQVRHQKFNEGQDLSLRLETGGEWKDVWEGSDILFFYEVNSGGFVNIVDKGKMALLNQVPRPEKVYTFGNKQDDSGTKSTFDPKGVNKGNAFNSALKLTDYSINNDEVIAHAKQIYHINIELQNETDFHPASVGMCVKAACDMVDLIDDVKETALNLLNDVVKPIDDWVDGGAKMTQEDFAQGSTTIDYSDVPF